MYYCPDFYQDLQVYFIRRVCWQCVLHAKRYYKLSRFLLLVSYFLYLSCCGYSTRSLLPGYMQKIHIKIFENQTIKAGLDELATNATIEAFRNGSSLHVVDEKQADIIIDGRISGYSKDPYIYTGVMNISQYKITIKFTIRCIDQIKNSVFWEGEVSDWATYSTNEEDGIREAIKKTAEKLVATILTNW